MIKKRFFYFAVFFEILYLLLGLLVLVKENFFDRYVPSQNLRILIFFATWSLVVFSLYWYLAFFAVKEDFKKIIFFGFFLFGLTLFLQWPFGSVDVFNYIYRSRVFTVYGQNPFIVPPGSFPNDIMDSFIFWKPAKVFPMPYGPVWALMTFLPGYVFQKNILLNLYSLKFIAWVAFFLSSLVLYKILSLLRPQERYRGLLLFLWNPFLLFEFIQNAHNDIVMALFFLLSLWFALRKAYFWVLPTLALSVMIKYQTIIFLPLFVMFLWKKIPKHRLRILLSSLLFSLILSAVFYFHFWQGIRTLLPAASVQLILFDSFSVLPLLIKIFTHASFQTIKIISFSVFFLVYAAIILRFIKSSADIQQNFLKSLMWTSLILYATIPWLMPWYFVLPVSLAILIGEKKYIFLMLLLTLLALWNYFLGYVLTLVIALPVFGFVWILKRLKV